LARENFKKSRIIRPAPILKTVSNAEFDTFGHKNSGIAAQG
jgi:hypothetical protein